MEERLTTAQVLRRTYPFVILRFLIIVVTILPIVWVTVYFAGFFFRLFNLNVTGIVYTVFWLNFAMIGSFVGVGIFGFVRKTILFYIKAAHVIAITKLCTDDVGDGSLTISSLNEMRKRFITVNVFYVADGVLLKGIRDIGNLILKQDVAPILKINSADNSFFGSIKTWGLRFLGKTIETTLSYCDEIVLSYIYVRSRLNELYGETEEHKKKDTIKSIFGYTVDGLCLYVKNCLPLMKSSFTLVLSVTIFGWVVAAVSGIVVFALLGSGIIRTILVFIAIRIIYSVVMYTFIEPYETAVLITEFYMVMYEDSEGTDLTPIKEKLLAVSLPFRKLVSKAMGREEASVDERVAEPSGHILDDNLLEIATGSIERVVVEDVGNADSPEE